MQFHFVEYLSRSWITFCAENGCLLQDFFAFGSTNYGLTSGICWNFSSKIWGAYALFISLTVHEFSTFISYLYPKHFVFFSSKQLEQQKWSILVIASHIPCLNSLNSLSLLSHPSSSSHVSWTWRALGLQGGTSFFPVQSTHSRQLRLMLVTVTEGLNT